MGFLKSWFGESPSSPPAAEWRVVTEPGPARGLFRVASRTKDAVLLEGAGSRVQFAPEDLEGATRPVLTRLEAEARLAELSTPSVIDPRHHQEQFIQFVKTLTRGSDAEVIGLLRERYAQTWAPSFGDRKAIDQLEQRLLPELAHVLGRTEAAVREQAKAPHAIMSAAGAAPVALPWPGVGSSDGVPSVAGLEPLGTLTWSGPIAIGPRLDRHAEADTGIAFVPVEPGTWHAWLELNPDAEAPLSLVLMRAGEESRWPPKGLKTIASTRPWRLAPSAPLQVVEQASLSDERAMDAVRYLGGTETYWQKAVSVALPDGLPDLVAIRAPEGDAAPHRVLSIDVCVEFEGEDEEG
jgi:hypothetical protein